MYRYWWETSQEKHSIIQVLSVKRNKREAGKMLSFAWESHSNHVPSAVHWLDHPWETLWRQMWGWEVEDALSPYGWCFERGWRWVLILWPRLMVFFPFHFPEQVQCHTYTGYCWCVTPDGKPISGSSVQNKTPVCSGTVGRGGKNEKGWRETRWLVSCILWENL